MYGESIEFKLSVLELQLIYITHMDTSCLMDIYTYLWMYLHAVINIQLSMKIIQLK